MQARAREPERRRRESESTSSTSPTRCALLAFPPTNDGVQEVVNAQKYTVRRPKLSAAGVMRMRGYGSLVVFSHH